MKNLILGMLFAAPIFCQALVAGPAKIEGVVKSFDDKVIIIENKSNRYEVPRDLVAAKDFKPGQKVDFLISLDQLEKVKVVKQKTEK